jgi:hypothetical protein
MQQAWMPQWRHARRCLETGLGFEWGVRAWGHTVDERVQDGHSTVGDTGVRVDLLED